MKTPVPFSTHSVNAKQFLQADGPPKWLGRPVLVDDNLPRDGVFEGPHPQYLRRLVLNAMRQAMVLIGADLGGPADDAALARWNEQLQPMVKALYPLKSFQLFVEETEYGRGVAFAYSLHWLPPEPRRVDQPLPRSGGGDLTVYEDGV